MIELRRHIRAIPDCPRPGIVFRDITPLLADRDAFHALVDRFVERYRGRADVVLGIESRGFLIGAAVAYGLGTGIALVRKPGKLPSQTYAARYELEYGSDTLEIHHDAIGAGHRVLIVDDLLATGGGAPAGGEQVPRCRGPAAPRAVLGGHRLLGTRPPLRHLRAFSPATDQWPR